MTKKTTASRAYGPAKVRGHRGDGESGRDPMDMHVAAKIRERRKLLGLTQSQLAEKLGVTFQQVQKYERGTNRVGAARLKAIAIALAAPITYFFENSPQPAMAPGFAEPQQAVMASDPLATPEAREMMKLFLSLPDPADRKRLLDMVRSYVKSSKKG